MKYVINIRKNLLNYEKYGKFLKILFIDKLIQMLMNTIDYLLIIKAKLTSTQNPRLNFKMMLFVETMDRINLRTPLIFSLNLIF